MDSKVSTHGNHSLLVALLSAWLLSSIGCASAQSGRESAFRPGTMPAIRSAARNSSPQPSAQPATRVVSASAQLPVGGGGNDSRENADPEEPLAETLDPSTLPEPVATDADSTRWLVGFGEYLIQPGDHLAIKFRLTPDLDEEVTVRPDGMIAVQAIGDVPAAYRTVEELRGILIAAYRSELREPEVAVIVRRFAGNHVFVAGEVRTPGSLPLAGRMTTLQAIIQSGGFLDTADRRRVSVRRHGGGWEEYDLHAELHGQGFGQDLYLAPYDVVYVPKSRIAKVNQFVDQYINRVLPFQRSFGFFFSSAGGLGQAAGLGP